MSDVLRDGYGRPLRPVPVASSAPAVRPLNGAANLGFELAGHLRSVGIDNLDRLCDVGAKEAWLRIRQAQPRRGNLATLLALHGAIEEVPVSKLTPEEVDALRTWMERHLTD